MNKRTVTLAILAVAAISLAITGCKNKEKTNDSTDTTTETSGG